MTSKYFSFDDIHEMNIVRKEIYALREKMFKKYHVDPLDTDALSSIAIFMIVTQYDPYYNVNFARNGEDAKSGSVLIEQKACRVNQNRWTKTGQIRKGYNQDASFQFHAMGTIESSRYIFAARSETDLRILRLYDIKSEENCKIVYEHLLSERKKWEDKNKKLGKTQKHDVIVISEKMILKNCNFVSKQSIDNCIVFRD